MLENKTFKNKNTLYVIIKYVIIKIRYNKAIGILALCVCVCVF